MKNRNEGAVRFLGKPKHPFRALKILGDFGEIEISSHFLYKKIEENPPGKNRRKKRNNIQKQRKSIIIQKN
jgi:hypothetical protein